MNVESSQVVQAQISYLVGSEIGASASPLSFYTTDSLRTQKSNTPECFNELYISADFQLESMPRI
jgi:hypothetical protein